MPTLQVRVSDELQSRLNREAVRRGLPPSNLVRMFIDQGCRESVRLPYAGDRDDIIPSVRR
jgi:antitoxin component of RelBE/YafQ-DinJ toxin-antitoxin module